MYQASRTKRTRGEGSIFRRKDGRWSAVLSIPNPAGGSKSRSLYAKTRDEVERKLATLVKQLGPALYTARVPKWTFEAYAWQWLAQQVVYVKARTMELYERELRTLVFPFMGAIPLTSVATHHIRDMQFAIAETGRRNSARRARDLASRVLKCAFAEGLISRNPADGVRKLPQPSVSREIWDAHEIKAFLDAAKDHPFYAFFYLALFTGMRPGELRSLEWECVEADRILVRQTATTNWHKEYVDKTKTPAGYRYIPMHPETVAVLEAYAPYRRKGYVFGTSKGTMMTLSNVRNRMFLPLIKKANVKLIEMYGLRHTFASMHIAAGTDVAKLAKWMGHTDPSFTLRLYVHAFDRFQRGPDRSAAELLGLLDKEGDQQIEQECRGLEVKLSRKRLETLLKQSRGDDVSVQLSVLGDRDEDN